MCPAFGSINLYRSEVATIESLKTFAAVHSGLQGRLVVFLLTFRDYRRPLQGLCVQSAETNSIVV